MLPEKSVGLCLRQPPSLPEKNHSVTAEFCQGDDQEKFTPVVMHRPGDESQGIADDRDPAEPEAPAAPSVEEGFTAYQAAC